MSNSKRALALAVFFVLASLSSFAQIINPGGNGGSGASGAFTILPKTANYTTVAADFSAAAVAPSEAIYTITTATKVTHTLPAAVTGITSGGFQRVRNDCSSGWALFITPATLTLDGSATTSIVVPPCREVLITFDGANFRSDVGQPNTASTGGAVLPQNFIPNGTLTVAVTTANKPETFESYWQQPVTIANLTIQVATAQAASHCDFGIYDLGGSLLTHTGSISCATATQVKTAASSTVTTVPGLYIEAWCTDTALVAVNGMAIPSALSSIYVSSGSKLGLGQGGVAACTAGVLPATITNTINSNLSGSPFIVVTP